jgi:hypothetical protein
LLLLTRLRAPSAGQCTKNEKKPNKPRGHSNRMLAPCGKQLSVASCQFSNTELQIVVECFCKHPTTGAGCYWAELRNGN